LEELEGLHLYLQHYLINNTTYQRNHRKELLSVKEEFSMKSVLLIGLGRFGRHMAQKLNELNHEVMAIDKTEERVDAVLPFVTNAQIGDSTNEEFLKSLGVNNYDLCIVAIGNDFQSSLETTSLLKELGAKVVISRASRDTHAKFLLRNGADQIIYPEKQVASWAAIRYSADHILDFIEIDERFAIFEVTTPEEWIGKTIGQIDIRKKFGINIMAIKQDGKMSLTILPDTVLKADETMLVLGEYKDIQKCFHI
jgi:trk system potassium uptake protein TrkA